MRKIPTPMHATMPRTFPNVRRTDTPFLAVAMALLTFVIGDRHILSISALSHYKKNGEKDI